MMLLNHLIGASLLFLMSGAALAQESPKQLPEDESLLQQQIGSDVDNFIVSQRALNANVAALNNDQKQMIDLLRSKVKWWQDCIANQPCADWVNQHSTPIPPTKK